VDRDEAIQQAKDMLKCCDDAERMLLELGLNPVFIPGGNSDYATMLGRVMIQRQRWLRQLTRMERSKDADS